jgi:hypothetical protein
VLDRRVRSLRRREVFGLPAGVEPVVMTPLGYPPIRPGPSCAKSWTRSCIKSACRLIRSCTVELPTLPARRALCYNNRRVWPD